VVGVGRRSKNFISRSYHDFLALEFVNCGTGRVSLGRPGSNQVHDTSAFALCCRLFLGILVLRLWWWWAPEQSHQDHWRNHRQGSTQCKPVPSAYELRPAHCLGAVHRDILDV
jgi:hypothetical protein